MSDSAATGEVPSVAGMQEPADATVVPGADAASGMGKMSRMTRSFVAPEDVGASSVVSESGTENVSDMTDMSGASVATVARGSADLRSISGAAKGAFIPTLILFTRVPKAGQAKTRLIPALGEQGAAEFQWHLLERLLGELRAGADQGLWHLCVSYCGAEGLERMQALAGEGAAFMEQVDDSDLGVRMRAALERELAAGAPAVGLMGSDLPEATTGIVAEALGLLKDPATDVALCPVEDGGYWFVGLKRPFPQLFEGTTYGGLSVFDDALAACAAHGRTVATGSRLHDVDTPEDLAWFEDWAAGSGARTAPAV